MKLPPKYVRFRHTSLNFKNKEIRLIMIKPDTDSSSPIQVTMKNVDFSERISASARYREETARIQVETRRRVSKEGDRAVYDHFLHGTLNFIALSYTWGPELPAQDILVTSPECRGWLSVRQNLYEFLKMRREWLSVRRNVDEYLEIGQSFDPASFWIDQICINQGKNDEKAHQVNQMADIYSAAFVVEAWLGSGFQGSDELMDLIVHENDLSRQSSPSRLSGDEREISKFIPSLRQFVRLPYWSRLWITQEIVLGRVIYLRIGSKTLLWDRFYQGWIRLMRVWRRLLDIDEEWEINDDESFSRIHDINISRRAKYKNWGSIITLVQGTECKDPRDRVFGMMGMLHPSLRVFPDYSMRPEDILLELLTKHVQDSYAAGQLQHRHIGYRYEHSGEDRQKCLKTAADWLTQLDDDDNSINPNSIRRHILKIIPPDPLEAQRIFGRAWRLKYCIWKLIPISWNMLERRVIFDVLSPSESWTQANGGLLQHHNNTFP